MFTDDTKDQLAVTTDDHADQIDGQKEQGTMEDATEPIRRRQERAWVFALVVFVENPHPLQCIGSPVTRPQCFGERFAGCDFGTGGVDFLSLIAGVVHGHHDAWQQCHDHHRHHAFGIDCITNVRAAVSDFARGVQERIVRFVQRVKLFKSTAFMEQRLNFVEHFSKHR